MKPFGYIYLITNLINRKIYVGKSESTIKERWYTHKWRANHLDKVRYPIKIDLAIAKYGENSFEIHEIDKSYNQSDLFRAEAYWIKFYDATNPDKGYNIDPMGNIITSDDYESIWEIQRESESMKQKKEKWRESIIKKKIPFEKEDEFKDDLINLTGVQLEKKYGFRNNRRALLREIRRILHDNSIETMEKAKLVVGGQVYDPKKRIPPEREKEFIKDFMVLSGSELEIKYSMSRRILVRNINEIIKKSGSNLLDSATSLEAVKRILGGKIYSDLKKKIPSDQKQEFIQDVRKGLRRRELCNKYELGTTAFYRELKRIFGVMGLRDIRKTNHYKPPIKKYIPPEREKEFKEDLKGLSGAMLEKKYKISNRTRLLREIRRVLNNENLLSMGDVKKFVGGKVYNSVKLKKGVPFEREKEFRSDINLGLTRRDLCEKYKFGPKVLYRELVRLFQTRSLEEARKK